MKPKFANWRSEGRGHVFNAVDGARVYVSRNGRTWLNPEDLNARVMRAVHGGKLAALQRSLK